MKRIRTKCKPLPGCHVTWRSAADGLIHLCRSHNAITGECLCPCGKYRRDGDELPREARLRDLARQNALSGAVEFNLDLNDEVRS